MIGAIAAHYVAETGAASWASAVAALSPWAWYRCNEASGPALDSSGNDNDAAQSAFGDPTYGEPSLVPSDPSDDSYEIVGAKGPESPGFPMTAAAGMSIAITYEGTGAGGGDHPIWKQSGLSGLLIQTNFILRAWNASIDTGVSASIIKDSAPHLVIATWKHLEAKIYVDGTEVASSTTAEMLNSSGTLMLGRDGGSHSLSGGYDEWVIANGIWTPTQVGDLHAAWAG